MNERVEPTRGRVEREREREQEHGSSGRSGSVCLRRSGDDERP